MSVLPAILSASRVRIPPFKALSELVPVAAVNPGKFRVLASALTTISVKRANKSAEIAPPSRTSILASRPSPISSLKSVSAGRLIVLPAPSARMSVLPAIVASPLRVIEPPLLAKRLLVPSTTTAPFAVKETSSPLTVTPPLLTVKSPFTSDSSLTESEPPEIIKGSSLRMLLRLTLPEIEIAGLAFRRLITTLLLAPGTVPVLQLAGLFQSPSLSEIQNTVSGGTSELMNDRVKGDARGFPARSAIIEGSTVSW